MKYALRWNIELLEFEIQQDVICLFSDTLQRAIQKEMISQEMVDLYDPR